jgi:hypothetical protein
MDKISLDIILSLEENTYWLRSEAMQCSYPVGNNKHSVFEGVKKLCHEWIGFYEIECTIGDAVENLWSSLEHI